MGKICLPKPDRIGALAALAIVAASCAPAVPTTTEAGTTTTHSPTTTEAEVCPGVFCVIYHIGADANWSDGVPVTAEDFIHTYEVRSADAGYELIWMHEAIDAKTVLFAFSRRYGPWQALFPVVLPAHVDDPLSVSAAPFVLAELGEEIVLTRNPEHPSDGEVGTIRFTALTSVRDGLRRLASGDADVVFPPSLDWVLEELDAMAGVERNTVSGPTWEQIAFNLDDRLLGEAWLREAINLAVDREAILDSTIRTVSEREPALGSAIWPDVSSLYVDVFPDAFDQDRAMEILIDRGCLLGEDGVFACEGERLSFVFATTIGDPWRRTAFELIRDDLSRVGIELEGVFLAPAELFDAGFFFGGPETWQLMGFPWRFSESPHLAESRFECEGTAPSGYGQLNVNRYCDEAVDDLVAALQVETAAAGRRDLYREIDSLYLGDLAVIPLYQRPVTVAWDGAIEGPHVNMSRSTHLWNIATWVGAAEVTIGLDWLPSTLDPLAPGDAQLILAPLTAGAYSVDPSLRFVPMLITSAEAIVTVP